MRFIKYLASSSLFLTAIFCLSNGQETDRLFVALPKIFWEGSDNYMNIHRHVMSGKPQSLSGSVTITSNYTEAAPLTEFQLKGDNRVLKLPELYSSEEGYKKIRVEVKLGSFNQSASIVVKRSPRVTFIQTDKPLYKPGDLIRFRVVSVSTQDLSESKLVRGATPKEAPVFYKLIKVQKPSRRIIKQWSDVNWGKGFQGFELRLPSVSRRVEFGSYKISAKLRTGEIVKSEFAVRKYVLPKFLVTVTPEKFILASQMNTTAKVCAKYTFGKPVPGRVRMSVCQPGNYRTGNRDICRQFSGILGDDGCNSFVFGNLTYSDDGKSLSPRNNNYPLRFIYTATVFEKGTNQKVTSPKTNVKIHSGIFKLEALSSKYYFTGLPYEGLVKASRHDGSPFPNPRVRVSLRDNWWWGGRKWGYEAVIVGDKNGLVKFMLPTMPDGKDKLFISIRSDGYQEDRAGRSYNYVIMGEAYANIYLKKRSSITRSVMSVKVKSVQDDGTGCPTKVNLLLTSNVPLQDKHINAQVVSRGMIQNWQEIPPTSRQTGCSPQNGLYGHYTCDKTAAGQYMARCLPGWTGSDCLAPVCAGGCGTGVCVRPNVCKCGEKFTGRNCQICVKRSGCLNGRCIGSRQCVCYYGYSGYNCNTIVSSFDFVKYPRGPGRQTKEIEWIPRAVDIKPPPTDPPESLVQQESELQNITINFREASVSVYPYVGNGARVVVFLLFKNEIISDMVTLNVRTCLTNEDTRVTFAKPQVSPGGVVNLALQTEGTNAWCALSASDAGLQAFGISGSKSPSRQNLQDEISKLQNKVFNKWSSFYDDGKYCDKFRPTPAPTLTSNWRPPYAPDYLDASFAFNQAGLILMSNKNLRTATCKKSQMMFRARTYDGAPERARPMAFGSRRRGRPGGRGRNQRRKNNRGKTDSAKSKLETKVRKLFPESWVWKSFKMAKNQARSKKRMTLQAPDSITSWRAEFMCVSDRGLGLAPPAQLTVFKPFFLAIALPYSVIRGERIRLPVSVHSYSKACYEVIVKLVTNTEDRNVVPKDGKVRQICMCSTNNIKRTVIFELKFAGLGKVPIRFRGEARPASVFCGKADSKATNFYGDIDIVERKVLVEPEGVPESRTQSALLCVNGVKKETKSTTFTLKKPSVIVPQSLKHFISWTADIMGPSMNNLQKLVRLPYGCGEQNMVTMVPSIFVLKYLNSTGKTPDTLRKKALRYIKEGYERELRYKHPDGSYSAFGKRDKRGSTWLTAFVVRSFYEAKEFYAGVDNVILNKAVNFLISQRTSGGCFLERGRVLSSYMQGGLGQASKLSLTAYVLPAITSHLRNKQRMSPVERQVIVNVIRKGVECLRIGGYLRRSNYLLALSAYALSEVNRLPAELNMGKFTADINKARTAIEKKMKGTDYDKYLSDTGRQPERTSQRRWWRPRSTSAEVETTAYALLALLKPSEAADSALSKYLPLVSWITRQRNAQGGWHSTQDTIVSLRALSNFGQLTRGNTNGETILEVTAQYNQIGGTRKIAVQTINEVNRLVDRSKRLFTKTKSVKISVSGNGCLVVVLNSLFNLPKPERPLPQFSLKLTSSTSPGMCEKRVIGVEFRYLGTELESGMSLIRVRAPSGWYVDDSEVNRIARRYKNKGVKRVELDGQTVELYLDSIRKVKQVYRLNLKRKYIMKEVKPSVITVTDYYRPEQTVEGLLDIGSCAQASKQTTPSPKPTVPSFALSCPVCVDESLLSNDTLLEQTKNNLIKRLCKRWSTFAYVSKRPQGYRVALPNFRGSFMLWDVNRIIMPQKCNELCPIVRKNASVNEFVMVSRYRYSNGLWPGSSSLRFNKNVLVADGSVNFGLDEVELPANCSGKNKVKWFAQIQRRKDEGNRRVTVPPSGKCPFCDSLANLTKSKLNMVSKTLCKSAQISSVDYTNRLVVAKYQNDRFALSSINGESKNWNPDIQLGKPEKCSCSLLTDARDDGVFLLISVPDGWKPMREQEVMKLKSGFLITTLNDATPVLRSCGQSVITSTLATTEEPVDTMMTTEEPTARIQPEVSVDGSGDSDSSEQSGGFLSWFF